MHRDAHRDSETHREMHTETVTETLTERRTERRTQRDTQTHTERDTERDTGAGNSAASTTVCGSVPPVWLPQLVVRLHGPESSSSSFLAPPTWLRPCGRRTRSVAGKVEALVRPVAL